ncbi:hypothetical protein OFC49_30625, partial [Escherichia coli]|nr:hypothetical protein [Escherichia coli]
TTEVPATPVVKINAPLLAKKFRLEHFMLSLLFFGKFRFDGKFRVTIHTLLDQLFSVVRQRFGFRCVYIVAI